MKLEDIREAYYTYSGKLSDINRQLIFAGIAFIWIFKKEATNSISLPQELWIPTVLFISALILDLMHYFISTVIWGITNRYLESKKTEVEDFSVCFLINWPGNVFFYSKVIVNGLAYSYLFLYVLFNIQFK